MRVIEYCFDQLFGHTRKPFNEIIHARAIFQVLEKGGNRNSRSTEYPSSAHRVRRAFNRMT